MSSNLPTITRETRILERLLGSLGFTSNQERLDRVGAASTDGLIEHVELGIRVHSDPEMVRLVVEATDDSPEYRLVLGRRGLGTSQALQIMAVHARAAVTERLN